MTQRIFSAEPTTDIIRRARFATFIAFEEYAPNARTQLYQMQKLFTNDEQQEAFERSFRFASSKDFTTMFPVVDKALDQFLYTINMHDTKNDWFKKVCHLCLSNKFGSMSRYSSFPPSPSLIFDGYAKDESKPSLAADSFASFFVFKWDPSWQTEADFKKNARIFLEQQLNRYIREVKVEAIRAKQPISYSPRGLSEGMVPKDAVNLIRYQILKEKFEDIAADSGQLFEEEPETYKEPSISGIAKGVRRFAALIGLALRANGRNRQK